MKKITKFLAATFALVLSVCFLAFTASAEQCHSHNWEMTQSNGSVTLQCSDCNTQVLMYINSILCEHEFESFGSGIYKGEKCVHCGYTVQNTHQFEVFFDNGVHVAECIDCGYTEYHPTSVISDEASHSFVCQLCDDAVLTDKHEMFVQDYNDECHIYECEVCGKEQSEEHSFDHFEDDYNHGRKCVFCEYSVYEPHNLNDAGFVDGFHVVECTGCNHTQYHSITESANAYVHSVHCEKCEITQTEEHTFEYFENDEEHGKRCVICNTSMSEPHTLLETGFVDGFHVIECTGCVYTEYHSITESADEYGHYKQCDECGKTESEVHSKENMTLNTMNEYFHYYECNLCGFIQCESHTSNCICGFACEHLNAIMLEINDYEHSFYCPNCCDEYIEEHCWERVYEDDENSSEFPVYCTRCQHTGTCTVEYGIMMSLNKHEDGYTIVLLTNGMKRHYKAWRTYVNPGCFVRVESVYGKCDRISRRVNAEVIDDLDNVVEYLNSDIRSKYRDDGSSLASLTVSTVNYIDDEVYVEFQDESEENFITSELTIYNMTSRLMEQEIKEGDVILYFTPKEEDSTIILIIG